MPLVGAQVGTRPLLVALVAWFLLPALVYGAPYPLASTVCLEANGAAATFRAISAVPTEGVHLTWKRGGIRCDPDQDTTYWGCQAPHNTFGVYVELNGKQVFPPQPGTVVGVRTPSEHNGLYTWILSAATVQGYTVSPNTTRLSMMFAQRIPPGVSMDFRIHFNASVPAATGRVCFDVAGLQAGTAELFIGQTCSSRFVRLHRKVPVGGVPFVVGSIGLSGTVCAYFKCGSPSCVSSYQAHITLGDSTLHDPCPEAIRHFSFDGGSCQCDEVPFLSGYRLRMKCTADVSCEDARCSTLPPLACNDTVQFGGATVPSSAIVHAQFARKRTQLKTKATRLIDHSTSRVNMAIEAVSATASAVEVADGQTPLSVFYAREFGGKQCTNVTQSSPTDPCSLVSVGLHATRGAVVYLVAVTVPHDCPSSPYMFLQPMALLGWAEPGTDAPHGYTRLWCPVYRRSPGMFVMKDVAMLFPLVVENPDSVVLRHCRTMVPAGCSVTVTNDQRTPWFVGFDDVINSESPTSPITDRSDGLCFGPDAVVERLTVAMLNGVTTSRVVSFKAATWKSVSVLVSNYTVLNPSGLTLQFSAQMFNCSIVLHNCTLQWTIGIDSLRAGLSLQPAHGSSNISLAALDCHFSNYSVAAISVLVATAGHMDGVDVYVARCQFESNAVSVQYTAAGLRDAAIILEDCQITGVYKANSPQFQAGLQIHTGYVDTMLVGILGCSLTGLRTSADGGAMLVRAAASSAFQLLVDNCIIDGNTASLNGGGVAFKMDDLSPTRGRGDPLMRSYQSLWDSSSVVFMTRTTIRHNRCVPRSVCFGGGVYGENVLIVLEDSVIQNNGASLDGCGVHFSGSSNVISRNLIVSDNTCLDPRRAEQIYFGTGGVFLMHNTSLALSLSTLSQSSSLPTFGISVTGASCVHIDDASTWQCPVGTIMLPEKNTTRALVFAGLPTAVHHPFVPTLYSLLVSCSACPSARYAVARSFVKQGKESLVNCLACPLGAVCDGAGSVKAVPGFWGFRSVDPSSGTPRIDFIVCPEGYCASQQRTWNNTCNSHRTGRLCGSCQPGFSQAVGSPGCVANADCTALGVYAVLFVCVAVLWSLYVLVRRPSPGGVVATAIFYYQIASSIVETTTGQLRFALLRIFDISVPASHVCIVHDLSTFASLFVPYFEALGVVVVFCLAFFPVVLAFRRVATRRGAVPRNVRWYLLFSAKTSHTFVCGMVIVLMLLYESVVRTTARLVHCVSLDGRQFMYRAAEVECYAPWQSGLFVVLGLLSLVPLGLVWFTVQPWTKRLPVSVERGTSDDKQAALLGDDTEPQRADSDRFYRSHHSNSGTLSGRPPVALMHVYQSIPSRRGTILPALEETKSSAARALLRLPFRESASYYQAVLMLQLLVFSLVASLVRSAVERVLWLVALGVAATVLHMTIRPYRRAFYNFFQVFCAVCWATLAILQLPRAVLLQEGADSDQAARVPSYDALQDVVLLAPGCLLVVYLVWRLWRHQKQPYLFQQGGGPGASPHPHHDAAPSEVDAAGLRP